MLRSLGVCFVCADSVLIYREGEKITLGSFLFRDDCYNLLLKLVKVSNPVSGVHGDSPTSPTAALTSASLESIAVAGDERTPEDTRSEPSESAPGTATPRSLAVASGPLNEKFETMVDAVLPCTTAQVRNGIGGPALVVLCRIVGYRTWVLSVLSFKGDACRQRVCSINPVRSCGWMDLFSFQVLSWVWGRDTNFWADFLRAQGETGLAITRWRKTSVAAEAGRALSDLFPREMFDEQRELTFTHPRTGFVVGMRGKRKLGFPDTMGLYTTFESEVFFRAI